MKNWPVASERLPLLRMKEYLTCVWKHLKWRHYTMKRRLFNARRSLFNAKRRLFKVLHPWPRVLSPNTNTPYTHICPDFHPWPAPHTQYCRTSSPVFQNALAGIYYFTRHIPWCKALTNSLKTGWSGSFKLAIMEALSNPFKAKHTRNAYIPCLRPRCYGGHATILT